ncbi:MAG: type II secretion system GspH family protein [Clostridiales bacterium]|jgi:prepilin-type N-terminal cleavage/methylation domain-containing protein|nr:type II secretion system GspH family protein [Clostridiales bacterium]
MKKGFSLVEVVMSIATLAIISGFVLEMFFVGTTLNAKARDLDFATNIAVNSIELFKSCDSLEEYIGYYKSFEVGNSSAKIKKYYDENWEGATANGASFALEVVCEGAGGNLAGELYYIQSIVTDTRDTDDIKTIVNLKTAKYLKNIF